MVITIPGKLISFRVDEETYKKLESMGKPSMVAKKIVLEHFPREEKKQDKMFELEQRIKFLEAMYIDITEKLETVKGILRKNGMYR